MLLVLRAGATLFAAAMLAGCGQEGRTTSGEPATSSGSSAASSGSGGSGGSGGAPPDPVALRVLNWNTRNFLNDLNDSAAPDEFVKSTAEYTAQRQAVGEVITTLAPDVVVFAEVENQAVLDDLNASELGGAYQGAVVREGNDPRGINIAGLSRAPFTEVVSHKDDSFVLEGTTGPSYKYSRDCIELHLEMNGRRVILLGVHFKAKTAPDQPEKRLAEAQYTRAIADGLAEEHPGAAIVILGDYNDLPGSPAVLAIAGAEPALYQDVAEIVAAGDRWTFDFNGELELVDHQMANPLLYDKLDPDSVVIRHGADVDAASDHAPILATYLIN